MTQLSTHWELMSLAINQVGLNIATLFVVVVVVVVALELN